MKEIARHLEKDSKFIKSVERLSAGFWTITGKIIRGVPSIIILTGMSLVVISGIFFRNVNKAAEPKENRKSKFFL
jgi:hypothetical protein